MSEAHVLLHDFNSIMNAAKQESDTMREVSEQVPEVSAVVEAPVQKNNNPLPEIPSPADVKAALNSTNIATILDRMGDNPEEMAKAMEESMGQLSPEIMEQARKLAAGGQGAEIMAEMKRRGMDTDAIRTQMLKQHQALKGMIPRSVDGKSVILITNNRQVKTRRVPPTAIPDSAEAILNSSKPVELSCSRLAVGPLTDKTIKIWCDPERKGKNKRLSKILGFPVGGEGLIVVEDGDLDEKTFLVAENMVGS